MPSKRLFLALFIVLLLGFIIWFFRPSTTSKINDATIQPTSTDTTNQIENLAILIFKQEQKIEFWTEIIGQFHLVKTSTVKTFSKHRGPKIYANQPHIPEGIYQIIELDSIGNMILNFPNDFDQSKLIADKRLESFMPFYLGTKASENSIALSKKDKIIIENVLPKVGLDKIKILIFPNDARLSRQFITCHQCPHWTPELYGMLHLHLKDFNHQEDLLTSDSTKSLN